MPQVSIIIPLCSGEESCAASMESILGQTFDDFEVLMVCNGTAEPARERMDDARVRILKKPHGGLGEARNFGAERAQGKYLLFVDPGDWIEPDMLQNLFSAAESYEADLVVFNYVLENSSETSPEVCRLPVNYPDAGIDISEKLLAELVGPDQDAGEWRNASGLEAAWRRMYLCEWYRQSGIFFGNDEEVLPADLPAAVTAHCMANRLLVVGGAYYHLRNARQPGGPALMDRYCRCFLQVKDILTRAGKYEGLRGRHQAWLIRTAAHLSLVSCYGPQASASRAAARREVRSILKNRLLHDALRSDYLKAGTPQDRRILRILRTGNIAAIYLYYAFYTYLLRKKAEG